MQQTYVRYVASVWLNNFPQSLNYFGLYLRTAQYLARLDSVDCPNTTDSEPLQSLQLKGRVCETATNTGSSEAIGTRVHGVLCPQPAYALRSTVRRKDFAAMSSQQLRVSIFPYIPDLAGDKLAGLTRFIADEFKKEHGVSVQVEATADPYDLMKLKNNYLADGEDAYDVMEVDTVLLGELAKSGRLQALEDHFTVTADVFASSAVQSVSYSPHLKSHLYGVPTLQCASFLMELADVDHTPKSPLLKDWNTFDQLKEALDREEQASAHRILLAGDFRGSWGLPMFYLDAYVDKHGEGSLYDGIDGPVDDPELIEELKEFTDYGRLESGKNPDIDGEFHDHHDRLIKEVTESQHILMYGYSENMGEALQKAAEGNRHKLTLRIISPPLDKSNNLLTYTDAAVVNKSKFADPQRAAHIIKFVEFYTSLPFRTSFAFGRDLPPPVLYPRYVLPARIAFFTETAAAEDEYYREFHAALKHSTPAPNHDIYGKRRALQAQLKKALGIPPKAYTQLK